MTESRRFPAVSWARVALACCAIAVGAAIVMGVGQGPATPVGPALASTGGIEPTERQRRVMRLVSEVMERQHYRQAVLDDNVCDGGPCPGTTRSFWWKFYWVQR